MAITGSERGAGPWGYLDFLEAVKDPAHKQHKSMLEWVGGPFDPAAFDAADFQHASMSGAWSPGNRLLQGCIQGRSGSISAR